MSLRTDIRSAYEEITPPAPALQAQIRVLVSAEAKAVSKSGGGRCRWVASLRGTTALVAVLLVILIVATVLVGGRLMQDWNSFRNPAPASDAQAQLAQLESRPLVLPTPASVVNCTSGPYNSFGSLGSGPIYSDERASSITNWGYYLHNLAYSQTNIDGPILIRVNDLFTHQPVVFVGQYAAGSVVGHDTVDGAAVEQRTELVFNTNQALTSSGPHKFSWPFTAGVPKSWSGSIGWQIDGVGFTEVFLEC